MDNQKLGRSLNRKMDKDRPIFLKAIWTPYSIRNSQNNARGFRSLNVAETNEFNCIEQSLLSIIYPRWKGQAGSTKSNEKEGY